MLFTVYKDHPRFDWLGDPKTEEYLFSFSFFSPSSNFFFFFFYREKIEKYDRIMHYLNVMLKFYFSNQEVWAYQDVDATVSAFDYLI